MRLLFLGDVFGKAGRAAVEALAPAIQAEERIDVTVMNVENVAGGSGVTAADADALLRHAQLLTSGNHIWSKREVASYLDAPGSRLLRPMNYPPPAPGRGVGIVEHRGFKLGVINLEGRLFMKPLDDPFRAADAAIEELRSRGVTSILVDFHAEATAEKWALGRHCDGRVSAVIGTHTHVQTADERVLKGGTAFLTDAGMCGPFDSVIGMKAEGALERFRTQRNARYEPAEHDVWVQGAVVEIDDATGLATGIRRVRRRPEGG
jgi:metallophosphoesterase (TIGR00282 family)